MKIDMVLRMKIILSALVLWAIGTMVHAAPMGEKAAVCYIFKADKLKSKSPCILSMGYGAGGSYASMLIGEKLYNAETSNCYDKKKDEQYECGTSLNGKDAIHYNRNLFYKKITDSSLITENSLSCYLSKDKKIDICVK